MTSPIHSSVPLNQIDDEFDSNHDPIKNVSDIHTSPIYGGGAPPSDPQARFGSEEGQGSNKHKRRREGKRNGANKHAKVKVKDKDAKDKDAKDKDAKVKDTDKDAKAKDAKAKDAKAKDAKAKDAKAKDAKLNKDGVKDKVGVKDKESVKDKEGGKDKDDVKVDAKAKNDINAKDDVNPKVNKDGSASLQAYGQGFGVFDPFGSFSHTTKEERRLHAKLFPPKDPSQAPKDAEKTGLRLPKPVDLSINPEDWVLDSPGPDDESEGAFESDHTIPLVSEDEMELKHQGGPTVSSVEGDSGWNRGPSGREPERVPASPPFIGQGLEGIPVEDIQLFSSTIRQQVLDQKIKNYQWSPSLLQNVIYFPDLQDPAPLDPADRENLIKGTPNLTTAAPCENLEGLGDLNFRIDERDYWFATKAVPRLHKNIYQEINTLAFILQEANTTADDGSRIGLDEGTLLGLLSKVIRLKIDTLSLLAEYQIDRCRRALRRPPRKARKESVKKPIISEKMLAEDDKKMEKLRKDAKIWGFVSARQRGNYRGGGTRRPRLPQNSFGFGGQPISQNSYPSATRKRGYTGDYKPKYQLQVSRTRGNDNREFKFGGFSKKKTSAPQQRKFFKQRGSNRRP